MNEAKGKVYYGLHSYPGLAEYQEANGSQRIFLHENTIRTMDPTFSGRPVFVDHVDEVGTDINEVRKEADGWVVESFYNSADGKHWAKFLIVSERGERAIAQGMRLSNCYIPKSFGAGGTWNGMTYDREVTSAEYEHLAIVKNPRYEESVIMTPEQFKTYNESQINELKRLANDKPQGENKMKLNWFKRAKVENAVDLESMSVVLPKSGREIEITKLINDYDDYEMKSREPVGALAEDDSRMVKVGDEEMSISELVRRYKELLHDEYEEDEYEEEIGENGYQTPMDTGTHKLKKKLKTKYYKADSVDNEDDGKDAKDKDDKEDKSDKKEKDKDKDDDKDKKDNKKKNDKDKADKLRNAGPENDFKEATILMNSDKLARGRDFFGSNKYK